MAENDPFEHIEVQCAGQILLARPTKWNSDPILDPNAKPVAIELTCAKCGNLITIEDGKKMCSLCGEKVVWGATESSEQVSPEIPKGNPTPNQEDGSEDGSEDGEEDKAPLTEEDFDKIMDDLGLYVEGTPTITDTSQSDEDIEFEDVKLDV